MLTHEQSERLEHIMRSLQADICRLHDRLDADEKKAKAGRTDPEPSGPPPMPEPVEVWLYRGPTTLAWFVRDEHPGDEWDGPHGRKISGPHYIIPGILSLNELAAAGFRIMVISKEAAVTLEQEWKVCIRMPYTPKSDYTWMIQAGDYPTALEAQWAATCLAKKGDG